MTEETKEETALEPAQESALVHQSMMTNDMVIMGKNKKQIAEGQAHLVTWFEGMIAEEKADLSAAEENLENAKKNKWRQDPFKRAISKSKKVINFFEKGAELVRQGYWLVPNFPLDVFAVRTSRKAPPKGWQKHYNWSNPIRDIASNSPPEGEGKYVDPSPFTETKYKVVEKNGEKKKEQYTRATEFDEEPRFPFSFVKPEILDATSIAKAKKIFDELGVMRVERKSRDPVVAGRILMNHGTEHRSFTFLVCWFIDTKHPT